MMVVVRWCQERALVSLMMVAGCWGAACCCCKSLHACTVRCTVAHRWLQYTWYTAVLVVLVAAGPAAKLCMLLLGSRQQDLPVRVRLPSAQTPVPCAQLCRSACTWATQVVPR